MSLSGWKAWRGAGALVSGWESPSNECGHEVSCLRGRALSWYTPCVYQERALPKPFCSISMLHFETLLLSVQQFSLRRTPYIHTAAAQMLHPFRYLEQSCDVIQSSCCSWFRNCGWFTIMLLLRPGFWLTREVENITSVLQLTLVCNRKENLHDWTVFKWLDGKAPNE